MKNTTNKILIIAVVILLLANIGLVIYMMKGRDKHPDPHPAGKGGPFEMMVKELNMTEQQQKDYEQLKEEHFKTIRPLADSIRTAKQAFFGLMKQDGVTDSTLDLYDKRIRELQSDADKLTFAHFRRVRMLFKDDQQKKFDEFIQKMMQRAGPGGRKKDSTGK